MTEMRKKIGYITCNTMRDRADAASLITLLKDRHDIHPIYLDRGELKEKLFYAESYIGKSFSKIGCTLADYEILIFVLDVNNMGHNVSATVRNIQKLLELYKGKIIFVVEAIPESHFSLLDSMWRIFSGNSRGIRAEVKDIPIQWFKRRQTDSLWKLLLAYTSNKRGLIACQNTLRLRLWQYTYQFIGGVVLPPLSPLAGDENRTRYTEQSAIRAFRSKFSIAEQDILIAVVGPINDISGYETVLKTLKYLPQNYKILFCGNITENSETVNSSSDRGASLEVICTDIEKIYNDRNELSKLDFTRNVTNLIQSLQNLNHNGRPVRLHGVLKTLAHYSEPSEISLKFLSILKSVFPKLEDHNRVRFLKQKKQSDVTEALAAADTVVFAHQESGAIGNSDIVTAAELNHHIFLSHTPEHKSLGSQLGNGVHYFDVGNDIELAQKIARYVQSNKDIGKLKSSPFDAPATEAWDKIIQEMLTS